MMAELRLLELDAFKEGDRLLLSPTDRLCLLRPRVKGGAIPLAGADNAMRADDYDDDGDGANISNTQKKRSDRGGGGRVEECILSPQDAPTRRRVKGSTTFLSPRRNRAFFPEKSASDKADPHEGQHLQLEPKDGLTRPRIPKVKLPAREEATLGQGGLGVTPLVVDHHQQQQEQLLMLSPHDDVIRSRARVVDFGTAAGHTYSDGMHGEVGCVLKDMGRLALEEKGE
mmetsp:Transcript_26773/g.36797  ORF Transcript_26773/g.36797 Transcript_26773/m.36797 type:complete len:228 (-) Transcript_26773:446-1129(-)